MRNTSPHRIAALLAVLALATAACSTAAADGTPDPSPTTEAPADDTPVSNGTVPEPVDPEPGNPAEPDITHAPIEAEGELPGEGHVPGGGELIAVDGTTVTVGFWMGVEDCYGVERIDVAETETKVAIDITVAARAVDQVCIEIAEARSVTVELDAPLGGRILEIGGAPVTR